MLNLLCAQPFWAYTLKLFADCPMQWPAREGVIIDVDNSGSLGFRGVGRWCRWCAGMASWRGICRTWLPMTLMVGWRDGILDRLFHWQLVSFFVWIVSSFRYQTGVLCSPPWCFEFADLDDYSVDLRITTLAVLVIILSSSDKNFTYWSDVQWEVQVEKSEAQGG